MILTGGYKLDDKCVREINNYLRQPSLLLISKEIAKTLALQATFSKEPYNSEKPLSLKTAMIMRTKVLCKL